MQQFHKQSALFLPCNLIAVVTGVAAISDLLRLQNTRRRLTVSISRTLEVVVDLRAKVVIVLGLLPALLLGEVVLLTLNPFGTHLLDLLLVVQLSIVALVLAAHALPPRKVLPVNGNAVVVVLAAGTDACPATLLLLEIETGCVGQEGPGQESTDKTEPRNEVELCLGVDVVVQDRGKQSSSLTGGSRETVSSGTDRCGEDLSGDQERDRVGAKLVEERRQEVHGLESVNVLRLCEEVEMEGRDNEEDEVSHETDDHHPLTSVQLVVDHNGGKVVSTKGDTDVDQVVKPADHDGVVARSNDLDKLVLEQLVAVEEDVVGEPRTSSSDQAGSEVAEGKLQGNNIVTGDVRLLLSKLELLGRRLHLEVTEVDEPESTNGRNGERDAVRPLSHLL